ncbi:MAG TPA: hypothetical protein P5123_08930 [Spirochaetota bacterium]|nr:hypothetical protein [Spirochaetota bacterium]
MRLLRKESLGLRHIAAIRPPQRLQLSYVENFKETIDHAYENEKN